MIYSIIMLIVFTTIVIVEIFFNKHYKNITVSNLNRIQKLTEENTTIARLIDEHLNEYKSKMIEWEELIKRQSGIEPNKKPPNEGMN